MGFSNKQTLKLKKTIVNGRNQTVYHAKVYRPRELPQLIIDENSEFIEVVTTEEAKPKDANSIYVPEKGVEVKTIQNVIEQPKEELPPVQEIEVKREDESDIGKVVVKRGRKPKED
jgi:hypothetical protein